MNATMYTVVHNATDGVGHWTNRGCNTTLDRASNTVRCNCSHLTNFGALVVRNTIHTLYNQRYGVFFLRMCAQERRVTAPSQGLQKLLLKLLHMLDSVFPFWGSYHRYNACFQVC